MLLTLTQAAKRIGVDKSTLLRARRKGRLSAEQDDRGVWLVDEAELRRVFPTAAGASRHNAADAEVRLDDATPHPTEASHLEARLRDALATVDDLRRRLDRSETERAEAVGRLTSLLMGPAERRRSRGWWRWRRSS